VGWENKKAGLRRKKQKSEVEGVKVATSKPLYGSNKNHLGWGGWPKLRKDREALTDSQP